MMAEWLSSGSVREVVGSNPSGAKSGGYSTGGICKYVSRLVRYYKVK